MHNSVMEWVGARVSDLNLAELKTLEVGSYNVNGVVRPFFSGEYIGLDLSAGPGVDIVGHSANMPFEDNEFETVVSTEMLEHDTLPWVSVAEMKRVLNPQGYLLLTARGYDHRGCFAVHDWPGDYWRFSVGGMRAMFEWVGLEVIESIPDPEAEGTFILARKPQ